MRTSPKELRHFLAEHDAFPRKRLGQNFLIDSNIVHKLVDAAEIQPGETVLEIGPGPGAITQQLVEAGAHVIAVEKDPTFAQALSEWKGVDVIQGDILSYPFTQLSGAKVVSNLPFHLTTPILTRIAPLRKHLTSLTIIIQEECARRITALPATSLYGSLTLFLAYFGKACTLFPIKRTCFYPAPRVDAAALTYHLHLPPPVSSVERLFKLVRTAFEQRRKMLRGSLRAYFSSQEVENALTTLGQRKDARPQDLSLEDFIRLADLLHG